MEEILFFCGGVRVKVKEEEKEEDEECGLFIIKYWKAAAREKQRRERKKLASHFHPPVQIGCTG